MMTMKILLGSTILLGVVACTYAPRIVQLEPLPLVSGLQFSGGLCVEVQGLTDARQDKEIIGTARNGLGMKTGEVRTYSDLPGWVTEQLRRELGQAGADHCAEGTSKYVLAGSVTKSYVDEHWNLDGTLTADLSLTLEGDVVFDKVFEARHSQISHAASTSEFTDTLFKTMQNLAEQVAHEIAGNIATVNLIDNTGAQKEAISSR